MSARPLILIVEDSPALAYTYAEYLRPGGWEIHAVETGAAALGFIGARGPDIVLLDLGLPDINGMDILGEVTERQLPTSVIVATALGSIQVAIDAMRAGAYDFIVKPFNADRLLVTVRNALEKGRLERIVTTYREEIDRKGHHAFIGSSLAMQAVYRIIDAAAPSKAPVFITGESGTGKELCAEAIHRQGPRRDKPFVAINCAAIPRDLIESEVFGHVKGAFTGAAADRDGAAARAQGGTLFLDEICEMDVSLQSKLLRFIQTGTFQRVGGNRLEEADVRFVAATNRDPLAEVRAGRFREDLFYRLHVIPIELPPLRERESDAVELARTFLLKFAKEEGKRFHSISPEAEGALAECVWPGNVRQLENTVRSAVVLNDGESLTLAMLPSLAGGCRPPIPSSPATKKVSAGEHPVLRPLWMQEREIIEEAIRQCHGNVPKAAAFLDISPSTIYRKRQSWGD